MSAVEECYKFAEGDTVLLIDRRRRHYLITLESNAKFHTHIGIADHNAIIGAEFGSRIPTNTGHILLAFSPTLRDFVEDMPHFTQVIYAKDLGTILMYGDIFPGAKVLEAGLGSGALTSALMRAVGPNGKVISFEINPDLIHKASSNIKTINPDLSNLEIKLLDVYSDLNETFLDRIILDVPEPWRVLQNAAEALVPGGIFLSYLPTILQVHQLQEGLSQNLNFELMETIEVLIRPWSITQQSVRPEHRMIAHTGFITTARKCVTKHTVKPLENDD